jgi:hypothetical protein
VTSYMRMSYLEHAERHLHRGVVKDLPLLTCHNAVITNFLFLSVRPKLFPPDSFPMVLSPLSAVFVPVCTSTYAPTDKTPTTHVNNDKTSRTLNFETSSLYTSNTHPNTNPLGPTINILNNESIHLEFNRPSTVLSCPIPVRITNRNVTKLQLSTKKVNTANLTNVKLLPLIGTCTTKYDFGHSVLLANTISLLPKIDEVRCFIHEENPDLACFTETWLHDSIINDHLLVPGYHFTFKNRVSRSHGGVCLYVKSTIPCKRLPELEEPEMEVLWSHIRPTKLPRGTPCIIVGIIYDPPRSDDKVMLRYLTTTLISVESLYPGCGILLAGDFNQLKIRRLLTQFKIKQLVHTPTRGNNILDLIINNMYQIYDHNSVQSIPPFGLSDHNGVLLLISYTIFYFFARGKLRHIRKKRVFNIPMIRTERFKRTFFPSMCMS